MRAAMEDETTTHVKETVVRNSKNPGTHLRRAHERSNCDRAMSDWHREWQAEFPKEFQECYMEAGAAAAGEPVRKKRTADIRVGKTVVEFQHSHITPEEVTQRTNDLKGNVETVWWVVDVTAIDSTTDDMRSAPRLLPIGGGGDRWLLHMPTETWKARSFETAVYDCGAAGLFLVDSPLCCGMREVQNPVTRAEFVSAVNRGESPFEDYTIAQTTLYRCQMGAGNGKTYNAVRLFDDPRFAYKTTFLFVTKAHSAKATIFKEFIEQCPKATVLNWSGKIVAKLKHRDGRKLTFAFATVDSLIHQVMKPGEIPRVTADSFANKVVHVGKDGIGENTLSYCGETVRLDKQALVVGDEMQDLSTFYLEAFVMLARETLVDVWLIGDKLQSLYAEENAFTKAIDTDGLPHAQCTEETAPVNECRRFGNKHRDFVNAVVDFDTFKVPRVSLPPGHTCEFQDDQTVTVTVMPFIPPVLTDKSKVILEEFCENVLYIFDRESRLHGCLPEDFLVLAPFVNCPMVIALTDYVNAWWETKFKSAAYCDSVRETRARRGKPPHPLLDDARVVNYCTYHKSMPGRPVDTSTSADSTRVVSVHSSKGDGREVVIALSITESALTQHAVSAGLLYTSMLHVALTRQKRALYVYAGKAEPLALKLRAAQFGDVSLPRIETADDSPFFKLALVLNELKDPPLAEMHKESRDTFNAFVDEKSTKLSVAEVSAPNEPAAIVEYEHHEIRYACMIHQVKVSLDREKVKTAKGKSQIQGQLRTIADLDPCVMLPKDWWKFVSYEQKIRDGALAKQSVPPRLTHMPLQQATGATRDEVVATAIQEAYRNLQVWTRAYMADGENGTDLAPRDVVLLCHAIWTSRYFTKNPIRPAAICELFQGDRGKELSDAHYAATHDVDTSVLHLLSGMRHGGRKVTALFDRRASVSLVEWEIRTHIRFALESDTEYAIVMVVPSLDVDTNLTQVLGNAVLSTLVVMLELADRPSGPGNPPVPQDVRVAAIVGGQAAPVFLDCQAFVRAHLPLVVSWIIDHFSRVNAANNRRLEDYVLSKYWHWGILKEQRYRFSEAQRKVLTDVMLKNLPEDQIYLKLQKKLTKSLKTVRALIFAGLKIKDVDAESGQ